MASIQLQIASSTLPFNSSVITSVAELTILAKIDFSSTVSIKSVVFNPVASQLGLHVATMNHCSDHLMNMVFKLSGKTQEHEPKEKTRERNKKKNEFKFLINFNMAFTRFCIRR
jgi:hypothetical protein